MSRAQRLAFAYLWCPPPQIRIPRRLHIIQPSHLHRVRRTHTFSGSVSVSFTIAISASMKIEPDVGFLSVQRT